MEDSPNQQQMTLRSAVEQYTGWLVSTLPESPVEHEARMIGLRAFEKGDLKAARSALDILETRRSEISRRLTEGMLDTFRREGYEDGTFINITLPISIPESIQPGTAAISSLPGRVMETPVTQTISVSEGAEAPVETTAEQESAEATGSLQPVGAEAEAPVETTGEQESAEAAGTLQSVTQTTSEGLVQEQRTERRAGAKEWIYRYPENARLLMLIDLVREETAGTNVVIDRALKEEYRYRGDLRHRARNTLRSLIKEIYDYARPYIENDPSVTVGQLLSQPEFVNRKALVKEWNVLFRTIMENHGEERAEDYLKALEEKYTADLKKKKPSEDSEEGKKI